MDNTYLTPTPEEQALIEQRDELLAALQSLFYATEHIEHIRPQLNKAAAAIVKAEGRAT